MGGWQGGQGGREGWVCCGCGHTHQYSQINTHTSILTHKLYTNTSISPPFPPKDTSSSVDDAAALERRLEAAQRVTLEACTHTAAQQAAMSAAQQVGGGVVTQRCAQHVAAHGFMSLFYILPCTSCCCCCCCHWCMLIAHVSYTPMLSQAHHSKPLSFLFFSSTTPTTTTTTHHPKTNRGCTS